MKKNNVKISVSNYGPIAEAENIELCPLTVFVGPSNTGKSYLAILVYALFNSNRSEFTEMLYRFGGGSFSNRRGPSFDLNEKMTRTLSEELFSSDKGKKEFSDLSEKLQEWINSEMAKFISGKFHQEIQRCMGVSEEQAIFIRDNFNLNWEDAKKNLTLRSSKENSHIQIKEVKSTDEELAILDSLISSKKEIPNEIVVRIFLNDIIENIFDMDDGKRSEPFYLPAARTGIMQSHRAIAGALVERAPFAGIADVSVPTLSGILSDFLKEIIVMDTGRHPNKRVGKIAEEMEDDILHGSVKTETTNDTMYPQFLYKQNGLELPLLRSSSMVSELAPIVLFLRHRVVPGDLLIIEEPESHLHPEAQRDMARVVVHLVRAGVRVMVTTHSEYFLEQLSNHVRRSKLQPSEDSGSFLKEEELGAYAFGPGEKGTIVERLKFDSEDGIVSDDHGEVSSDLYNETVDLLERMDDNG